MAERRMFTRKITESDAFLDMPSSTQMLYFHLAMNADDDGFVNNPKQIQRMCMASEDDMRVLLGKKFIISFDSGIIVIKHWRMHNYIRSDRYKPTDYESEMGMLSVKENNAYTLVSNLDTVGIQMVSVGKDSIEIGKDIAVINNCSSETKAVSDLAAEWNKLSDIGIKPICKLSSGSKRYASAQARIKQYGYETVVKAIHNIRDSDFLIGKNKNGWVITFDWFVLPNNFPKVLEGNYSKTEQGKDDAFERWMNK